MKKKNPAQFGLILGPGIADLITVGLHNAGNYGIVEYSDPNVMLSTSGYATVSIPTGFNGLHDGKTM
ncbi:MAG: hypothetical protein AB9834_04400 [Lentimicrobium sp.]